MARSDSADPIASCTVGGGTLRLSIDDAGAYRIDPLGWTPTPVVRERIDRLYRDTIDHLRARYSPADGHPAAYLVGEFARRFGATDVVLDLPATPTPEGIAY